MNRPNQLTTARIFLTPVFVYLLLQEGSGYLYLATAVFVVASLTDWWDGWMARRYGYVTSVGKFLDPLADKVLISSALIAFSALGYLPFWMVVAIIARDVIITGLRYYGWATGKSLTTSTFAKWKTFSQVGLTWLVLFGMNLEVFTGMSVSEVLLSHNLSLQDLIQNAALWVTLYTAATGLHYLAENRQLLKALAWRFFRVFIPS